MEPGLEMLLDGAIDYAGLFPPAKLDMKPAVLEFIGHHDGAEGMLVKSFVCPASRLEELGQVLEEIDWEDGFALVSVVGSGIDKVKEDGAVMARFSDKYGEEFEILGYEVRSGPDVNGSARSLTPLGDIHRYLEIPLDENTSEALHVLADSDIWAKVRTGGLSADSFPPPDMLAGFLRECIDLELTFKLTAGLHHPIRRKDPETGGTMHGFLNVFTALALAYEHELSRGEIAAILSDEDPRNFIVDTNEVGHNSMRASWDSIEAARELCTGFGSCSVNEPVEDLKTLGLW